MGSPVVHAGHEEEAVVVVDVHRRVRARELVDGGVVVDAVARADELVRPADVLQQLPVVLRPRERGQVRVDRLTIDTR